MPAHLRRMGLVLVGGLAIWWGIHALATRFTLGFDRQGADRCLPWRVFLVDKQDKRVQPFDLVAFRTRGVPFFRDGTPFVKFVAGMQGDLLEVDATHARVRDVEWGPINARFARALNRAPGAFRQSRYLSQGEIAVMTGADHSFDSRYWGPIHADQVIGKAVPLW